MGLYTVQDAAAASGSAMSDYSGKAVKPVVLVGTQMTSGMNCQVICVGDATYSAVVHQNASGESQASSMEASDWSAYAR